MMIIKQTIIIIGATGKMGSAIAKSLSKGNYRLLLNSRNHDKTKQLITEVKKANPATDIEGIDCSFNGCWEADIIISAVPYAAEKDLAKKIKDVANQKIVISIANPLNENYDGLTTTADTSAAEEFQKLLPNSRVVKAFNTTFAADFYTPVIDGKQTDAFIAGNSAEALQIVEDIVKTAGFNPVVAGNLSTSRTLENMQLLLIQLSMKNNFDGAAGWKNLHNENKGEIKWNY